MQSKSYHQNQSNQLVTKLYDSNKTAFTLQICIMRDNIKIPIIP